MAVNRSRSRSATSKVQFRKLLVEDLEDRRLLASVSAPAILQWFDGSFGTIEDRTSDVFEVGYGSVWLPPPGRADSGNFSVGYDVYDRFDLGSPDRPTLYGTETGLTTLERLFDRASIDLHVDTILNHNGFSDQSTTGFVNAGGYPGFAVTLPNAIDGDFHSAFESGDLRGRLSGLIDINHTTNHQFIRQPVDPNDPNNIPPGTEADPFGRLANVPSAENRQFYPDLDEQPIFLFDPVTGESNIAVYPFDTENPMDGDPVQENALGLQMRYMQWLVQVVGVDGLRIDAAKHFDGWVMDYLDRAVYRSHPEPLLDGSTKHVFSYSEVFDGDTNYLLSFVKKNIDPADPGRIGGNRDALDFSAFFAMKANLDAPGTPNAWSNIRNSMMDVADDGLQNGSAGVLFVNSHDEHGPNSLANVAHAFTLMYPGNTVVYLNGKEFGDGRDFPKDGRGDALGGVFGDTISTLVGIRNTHGRGNFLERWNDSEGLYVFERESSAVVGLSNRGDGGFDQRTVSVAFAPGTHLVELTGNAADPFIDPNDQIPDVVTVSASGTIDIRVPRNANSNGEFHGKGYVIYGLPTPQAPDGLEILGATSSIPGGTPAATNFENGTVRLSDLDVITTDTFDVRLQTNEVRLLGLDSLRDIFADGDNALLSIDGGTDVNGNGAVDFVAPGTASYGFETFGTKSNPLVGPQGVSGPRGDGEFLQTVDATTLSEGVHFIEARAFRHRTDGGPAVFSNFRETVYVDRLPPESEVLSFEPFEEGVNENRDLIVRSVDKTADNVHVFLNLPAGMSESEILALVGNGQGSTRRIDRDQFIFGFFDVLHGNNVATVVSFEPTGNYNVQRIPGLFTSTIFGAGLGDLDFDGTYTTSDLFRFRELLCHDNSQFNPAADLNADGWITFADFELMGDRLADVNADQSVIDLFNEWDNDFGVIDTWAPVADVNELPEVASSKTFTVSVMGMDLIDPAYPDCDPSGLHSVDIYVSENFGEFTYWTTVLADAPEAEFTGESGNSYAFYSLAMDQVGNRELVPSSGVTVEAGIRIPDLDAPVGNIANVDATSPQFLLSMNALETGGSGLAAIELFVSIDGSELELFETVIVDQAGANNYNAVVPYAAFQDGQSHEYGFVAIAMDQAGNREPLPLDGTFDATVTAAFDAPVSTEALGIVVANGLNQRSFIRNVDILFNNESNLESILASGVSLIRYETDGTGGANVDLAGLGTQQGTSLRFDFGLQGIGGNRSQPTGNGIYEFQVDEDLDGTVDQVFRFYRLLGDTNGDGIVNGIDQFRVQNSIRRGSNNANTDLNGDGIVDVRDRRIVAQRRGDSITGSY